MEAEGDTILDIRLHPLENLSRNLDGTDDSAQARRKEDDVGGGLYEFASEPVVRSSQKVVAYLCCFRSSFNSNTTIGFLQRRRVVYTIA